MHPGVLPTVPTFSWRKCEEIWERCGRHLFRFAPLFEFLPESAAWSLQKFDGMCTLPVRLFYLSTLDDRGEDNLTFCDLTWTLLFPPWVTGVATCFTNFWWWHGLPPRFSPLVSRTGHWDHPVTRTLISMLLIKSLQDNRDHLDNRYRLRVPCFAVIITRSWVTKNRCSVDHFPSTAEVFVSDLCYHEWKLLKNPPIRRALGKLQNIPEPSTGWWGWWYTWRVGDKVQCKRWPPQIPLTGLQS